MKRKEAMRFIENAKEILSKSSIERNYYTDLKYVKTAMGCAYLGVLRAMDDFLLSRNVGKNELPKKIEEYLKALKKYGGVHNGKLMKEFDALYDELHIGGYYRGTLRSTPVVKEALKDATVFIERLSSLTKEE
ncbi:MAG: DUF5618 family protein [bacterium]